MVSTDFAVFSIILSFVKIFLKITKNRNAMSFDVEQMKVKVATASLIQKKAFFRTDI